jgi:hypothetical protein
VSLAVRHLPNPTRGRIVPKGGHILHLAAALAVQNALAGSEPVTFAASDLPLTEAATLGGSACCPCCELLAAAALSSPIPGTDWPQGKQRG